MKRLAQAIFLALSLALAAQAPAQHQKFTINPDSSQVTFALGGNAHSVHGTFHVASGAIEFDPGAGSISGSVVVSALSGESGDKGRDKKMQSDVLESAKFAEVTFAPKSYTGAIAASGDSTIHVTGVFTLHGAAHEIAVPMQLHADGSNLTARGRFTVPYVQWGLKDPSIFILKVAKDVEIELTLVGTVSK
ncbi:MAG: YceI family protein [Terracidiphilus sp.]